MGFYEDKQLMCERLSMALLLTREFDCLSEIRFDRETEELIVIWWSGKEDRLDVEHESGADIIRGFLRTYFHQTSCEKKEDKSLICKYLGKALQCTKEYADSKDLKYSKGFVDMEATIEATFSTGLLQRAWVSVGGDFAGSDMIRDLLRQIV